MRSFILVMIWTVLFIALGIYNTIEIDNFTQKYTDNIELIASYIYEDDWENAKDSLEEYYRFWHEERIGWYKLLNHNYFDSICTHMELLNSNISVKDKSKALEKIELIKSNLSDILDGETCDSKDIF